MHEIKPELNLEKIVLILGLRNLSGTEIPNVHVSTDICVYNVTYKQIYTYLCMCVCIYVYDVFLYICASVCMHMMCVYNTHSTVIVLLCDTDRLTLYHKGFNRSHPKCVHTDGREHK